MNTKRASIGTQIIEGLREFADALESGSPIREKFTCRRVVLNIKPSVYRPAMVKKTRELLSLSQPIFARFLGVSVQAVRSWEQGVNTPSDIASRFMDEIRRDPDYWMKRLNEASLAK
jgi:putative transcriptional regulator